MKNYLCIHGHFYQPPREDPWSGVIPHQESAEPFQNWNERIAKECYGANANSRFLSPSGKIADLVNNYRYLSFNIGPTLLDWLCAYAPAVYNRIIEADAWSLGEQGGHGNAIAQGYNHIILPLADPEEIRTQIRWGLHHFEHHFGRRSEGFWLPETAINETTAEILVQEGVKYVILSPWQAESIVEGNGKPIQLDDTPAPSHRCYRLSTPSGDLAVFFYNQNLAQKISFEHYLHSADILYNAILSTFKGNEEGNLISIATDGEVYGHHEPFGDMCLAALFQKILRGKTLEIVNYGRYLELYPPTSSVTLRKGEDSRGTSWSCHHGVSRWYRNCGCVTGGKPEWNQEWRTPLRNALNELWAEMKRIYVEKIAELSPLPPFDIRDRYIDLICGKISRTDFLMEILTDAGSADENAGIRALRLLEGQRFGMYMFTSCGWFFADISGIEPTQNLAYAVRAIELYRGFISDITVNRFLNTLEGARSNREEYGDGRRIVELRIIPFAGKVETAAAELVLRRLFSIPHDPRHAFRIQDFQSEGEDYTRTGNITIEHVATGQRESFAFRTERDRKFAISLYLRETQGGSQERQISPAKLSQFLRSEMLSSMTDRIIKESQGLLAAIGEPIQDLLAAYRNLHTKPSAVLSAIGRFTLSSEAVRILSASPFNAEQVIPRLRDLLAAADQQSLELSGGRIGRLIVGHLERLLDTIRDTLDITAIHHAVHLYTIAMNSKIPIDITILQNAVFRLILESGRSCLDPSAPKTPALSAISAAYPADAASVVALKRIILLGETFGIEVEKYKNALMEV